MKRQQPSTVLQDTPREPFNLRLFPTNPRTLCLLQMFLALSFSSGAVAQKDTERRTNDNNPAYAGRLNAEPLNVLWDFG
ncbi:MAG: hypothetical protein ACE5GA_10985, partial [Candidatus Zixiibacteriota bacterium]